MSLKKLNKAGAALALAALVSGAVAVAPAQAQAQEQAPSMAELRAAVDANPDSPQALFALAKQLAKQGQASQAIRLYKRILVIDPSLARVHLNLGILLFQQGELEDARHHLSIALTEGRGSPEVQRRVQSYIDEIDARLNIHNVYGYVLLAGRYQSNPTAGPLMSDLDVGDSLFDPNLDDEALIDDDFGGVFSGDINWQARLEKSGAVYLETHAQLYGSAQSEDDLNLFIAGLDIGPRFRLGTSYGAPNVRLYGLAHTATLGGDDFLNGFGGGVNFAVNFAEDVKGALTYELEARDYSQNRDDTTEHRMNAELQVGVLGLDSVRVMALGRITDADQLDYQSLIEYGAGIDLQKSFRLSPSGNTWSIAGGFLVKQRDYDGIDPTIAATEEREQTLYRFSGTGSIPLTSFAAIMLGAAHTISDSNIGRFEYDNTEATAGVLFHF